MKLSKKVAIPLAIILLAAVGGGGYYLWQQKQAGTKGAKEKTAQGQVLYTCAMHPFIIKDKPGSCPICGMQLIKKVAGAQADAKELAMLGHVTLSPTQQVMANIATAELRETPLNKEINAVGIVQFDQSRQSKVTAWIAGRIDKLNVNTVGAYVSKDRPVAEVYSPDLLATQQEYLLAVKSRDQLKNSPITAISGGGEGLVQSARQRLQLFGVKDSQIAELEKAGKPTIRLPIYTPLSGVVIEKLVQQGQYVNMGDMLFNIADLSVVWVELEVYENEFRNIRLGQKVEIRSQSYPGKPLTGRVAYIYPFLDPKTRTVKVRVEMPNPGMKLKPDMFVNATVKVPLGSAIVAPITAVIDTGKRKVVWVESSPGMFEPRDVQVGQQTDDQIQILSGVKAGEKVAVSGGYLIDSEAQLKGGAGPDHSKMPGMKMDEKGGQPAAPAAPKAPGHEGMKMDDMKM